MNKVEISSNMEDYLETISEIIDEKGHAHTKDIADKMGVKMPSVTSALQALAGRGLLNYQSHTPVVLTSKGKVIATGIRRRHQELRRFFHEILKLDANFADATACKVEHLIDESVLFKIIELVNSINSRSDCAGLREHLENVMPQLNANKLVDQVKLSTLKEGESGVVCQIDDSIRNVKAFSDWGVQVGVKVTLEKRSPFGELLRLKINDNVVSIRQNDADYIQVCKK